MFGTYENNFNYYEMAKPMCAINEKSWVNKQEKMFGIRLAPGSNFSNQPLFTCF